MSETRLNAATMAREIVEFWGGRLHEKPTRQDWDELAARISTPLNDAEAEIARLRAALEVVLKLNDKLSKLAHDNAETARREWQADCDALRERAERADAALDALTAHYKASCAEHQKSFGEWSAALEVERLTTSRLEEATRLLRQRADAAEAERDKLTRERDAAHTMRAEFKRIAQEAEAEAKRLREALVAQARRGAVSGNLCWCDSPRGYEEGTGEREPHSAHCLVARAALSGVRAGEHNEATKIIVHELATRCIEASRGDVTPLTIAQVAEILTAATILGPIARRILAD